MFFIITRKEILMLKKSIVLGLTIACLLIFSLNVFSQDYKQDSLAVRAILDSNGLSTVTVEEVSKVGNNRIDTLLLQQRGLSTLPSVIGNITKLLYLDLHDNTLKSIPSEIGNLKDLIFLDLRFNELSSIPTTIGELKKLTWLDCRTNEITTIPAEIGDLAALERLYFSSNNINSIPSEIGNLVNLRGLYIEDNDITAIPTTIENMAGLDILWIHKNKITAIPKEIGELTGLQNLSLSNNNISSAPPEIGNCSMLNTLKIDHNQLTTLPDSITLLVPLQGLDLGYNHLDTNNLSDTVISWADQYDPDWKTTQTVGIIHFITEQISKSISIIHSSKTLKVHFELPSLSHVNLDLVDAKGKTIKTLFNEYKTAGTHVEYLDMAVFGSGIYYLSFTIGEYGIVRKTVIVK